VELTNLTPGVTLTNGTTVSGLPAVQVIGAGASLAPGQTVQRCDFIQQSIYDSY